MRKATIITLSILFVIFFISNIFPYATNSGNNSLNSLFDKVKDWINQSKPEELNNDNYNVKTHPWLALRSIQLFEQHYGITLPFAIKVQIIIGSIEEDYDIAGTSTINDYNHLQSSEILSSLQWENWRIIANVNRSENHFMNSDYDVDGLNYGTGVDTERNTSALKWAKDDPRNLTNFSRAVVEGNTEKGWRYLGHILHLLEDMSVPAHVRNDAHIFNKDNYEDYLSDKNPAKLFLLVGSNLGNPLKPSNIEIDNFFKELSNYSRNNYFSDDTVFENSCYGISLPVAQVSHEDDDYFYGNNGKKIAYKGILFWSLYWTPTSPTNLTLLGITNYDLV